MIYKINHLTLMRVPQTDTYINLLHFMLNKRKNPCFGMTRSASRTQGMFYPLLRSLRTDREGPLLNLKAAFHMGVKDTEIGCI